MAEGMHFILAEWLPESTNICKGRLREGTEVCTEGLRDGTEFCKEGVREGTKFLHAGFPGHQTLQGRPSGGHQISSQGVQGWLRECFFLGRRVFWRAPIFAKDGLGKAPMFAPKAFGRAPKFAKEGFREGTKFRQEGFRGHQLLQRRPFADGFVGVALIGTQFCSGGLLEVVEKVTTFGRKGRFGIGEARFGGARSRPQIWPRKWAAFANKTVMNGSPRDRLAGSELSPISGSSWAAGRFGPKARNSR